jgi:hypothetical protein
VSIAELWRFAAAARRQDYAYNGSVGGSGFVAASQRFGFGGLIDLWALARCWGMEELAGWCVAALREALWVPPPGSPEARGVGGEAEYEDAANVAFRARLVALAEAAAAHQCDAMREAWVHAALSCGGAMSGAESGFQEPNRPDWVILPTKYCRRGWHAPPLPALCEALGVDAVRDALANYLVQRLEQVIEEVD